MCRWVGGVETVVAGWVGILEEATSTALCGEGERAQRLLATTVYYYIGIVKVCWYGMLFHLRHSISFCSKKSRHCKTSKG